MTKGSCYSVPLPPALAPALGGSVLSPHLLTALQGQVCAVTRSRNRRTESWCPVPRGGEAVGCTQAVLPQAWSPWSAPSCLSEPQSVICGMGTRQPCVALGGAGGGGLSGGKQKLFP